MIEVTDTVVDKIQNILSEVDDSFEGLRISISGGGCSGFQYIFGFAKEKEEDDTIIEKNGIKVLIDPISLPYLDGAVVDYKKSLAGEHFSINNPNATAHCGCGSSFRV